MPADFDKCVANGGRVRTINVNSRQYMHVCYGKDGKSHAGEVRTREKKELDPSMLELLGLKERQRQQERDAIDNEIKESKERLDNRIAAAKRDPTINL